MSETCPRHVRDVSETCPQASSSATGAGGARVEGRDAGEPDVNGEYKPRNAAEIPRGFAATCAASNWAPVATWHELSEAGRTWFESANGSYFYWNRGDGRWWLDGPSGAGLYAALDRGKVPPQTGWTGVTRSVRSPMPVVSASILPSDHA